MSQNSDDLTTQPTAKALMERVREVELRLANDIDNLATRFEGQLASFREEILSSVQAQNSSMREEILSSVHAQNSSMRNEILSGVQSQISSLREEVMKGFYKLNSRVLSLAEDMLDIRANEREILKRLFDPEISEKTT